MPELHTEMHTGRSGDEPMHARSPLRLRLGLAGFGLACAIAGIVVFALTDVIALVAVFAALAVLAVADAAIILRHIRAGSRYQPGPEIPPYRPLRRAAVSSRPAHPEAAPPRRHARFFWAAAVALVLIINAWTWVSDISTGAAAVLSIIAAVLLPLGVITANAGSPALQGNSIPDTESEVVYQSDTASDTAPETSSDAPAPAHAPAPQGEQPGRHRHHRRRLHPVGR